MTVALVLADDHPVVLDGLEQIFSLEPDFKVLARTTNGRPRLAMEAASALFAPASCS